MTEPPRKGPGRPKGSKTDRSLVGLGVLENQSLIYRKTVRDLLDSYGLPRRKFFTPQYMLIDCIAQRYAALHYFRKSMKDRIPTPKDEAYIDSIMKEIERSIERLDRISGNTAGTDNSSSQEEENPLKRAARRHAQAQA